MHFPPDAGTPGQCIHIAPLLAVSILLTHAQASEAEDDSDSLDSWHMVYEQVLEGLCRADRLTIAMVKDLPSGEPQDMETFVRFEMPPRGQSEPAKAEVLIADGTSI